VPVSLDLGIEAARAVLEHRLRVKRLDSLTRIGYTLRWEATLEDPNVLTKPWKMTPRTVILTDGMIYEQPICEERETPHMVNKY
jgi:hypothetical protein